jgi:hypothetical protein
MDGDVIRESLVKKKFINIEIKCKIFYVKSVKVKGSKISWGQKKKFDIFEPMRFLILISLLK